jgi:hypothetical protein
VGWKLSFGVEYNPGFLPLSLLETEAGRKESQQIRMSVMSTPQDLSRVLVLISTSCLAEQQGDLSQGFFLTKFHFLHLPGIGSI